MGTIEQRKQDVGKAAAELVENQMKLGLGSGSTAYWFIQALAERVKAGEHFFGIPTSNQTAKWAKEAGIELINFEQFHELDLAIDGADEVDANFQLIKGGGGALLREKLVASAAKAFIVIVDGSKVVDALGRFPLPVEVVPFGWNLTQERIKQLGGHPTLRMDGDAIYQTDNGNYILDCSFGDIHKPATLNESLREIVGIVETGLFIDMVTKVFIGDESGVQVLDVGNAN